MATRIRDGLPGKEKTLPRQAKPVQRRTSINPSPSPSPSRPVGPTSISPSSDKNVPNHPRPARTGQTVTKPTQSAAVRKPASAAAAASDKPSLPGRRLLNKTPLSASQSSKTLQSPNPKTSSSLSAPRSTGTTTRNGAPNRIVKTAPKDVVKKQSLHTTTPSLKKTNATTKSNSGSYDEASMPSSVISSSGRLQDPQIVDVPHPQEDDRQSSVTDEEVPISALSSHITNEQDSIDALRNYEVTDDVVKDQEQQTETIVQAKPDIHEQEDIKIIESPTSEVDNQYAAEGSMKTEEAEVQNTQCKETSNFHLESQQLQEPLEDNSTDPVNANLEVEDQGEEEEEVTDATEAIEKKEEVKEEDQVVNLRETTEVEHIASPEPEPTLKPEQEPAPEPAPAPAPAPALEENKTVAPKQSITAQWKKESSAVSNDTIEETANKLRDQRRNRVRALAGAFESVMQQKDK